MKKTLKVTMGVALAASALAPVAAFAAEDVVALDGFYNTQNGVFYSVADFKALDKAAKKAVFQNPNFILVMGGNVYPAASDLISKSNDQLETTAVEQAEFEANNDVTFTNDGKILDKDGNEIGTPVATKYKAVTTAVTEGTTASVYIEAEDQFGESIEVPANVEVSGTLNELPLTDTELLYNAAKKSIDVNTDLRVGDVLVINVGGQDLTFTVIEQAASELKTFNIQAPKTVKSGETAAMVVVARDQFNNPVTPDNGQVRWTVNGKIEVANGNATYNFDKKAPGQYEVKAYYIVNGKVNATASITVTVETADLATAIAEANDVKDLGYTKASWDTFKAALDGAKAIAADTKATQADIDGAIANLEAAKAALMDAAPELTKANIAVAGEPVEFTSVTGASATLDLSGLAPASTATVAKVTASEAATLTLSYKGVTKKVELVKGENTLSASDLIPGLKPSTPLTIGFLQSLNASGTLDVTTELKDKTTEAGQTVSGVLTLVYDAK